MLINCAQMAITFRYGICYCHMNPYVICLYFPLSLFLSHCFLLYMVTICILVFYKPRAYITKSAVGILLKPMYQYQWIHFPSKWPECKPKKQKTKKQKNRQFKSFITGVIFVISLFHFLYHLLTISNLQSRANTLEYEPFYN